MAERLTITVVAGGEDANARAFNAVLDDTLDALEAIARERGGPTDWRIVALSKNSPPKITLAALSRAGLALTLLNGLAQLEQAAAEPFGREALRAVKRLGDRIGNGVDAVVFETEGSPAVAPTAAVGRYAGEAIAAGFYYVPGSVDGKLDIVNVHSTTKFSIFDDVDNREVRCAFDPALFDLVKRNIGRRVTAVGDVRYNAGTDLPVSIKVQSLEPLEGETEALLLSDMPSIDLAPGVASEDYVRRMRDGD